jgi:hypothetical protein
MVNFAKRAAVVSTNSLETQAQMITRNSNKAPDRFMDTPNIDNKIIQSMQDQGMINNNSWGPGQPIEPNNPLGEEPRQFEYQIGQNIVQRPRSTESISFDTMRDVIENYDVAQMCIEVRQDELRNLDWNIVPYDEEETDKYSSEIKQVRQFFEKPDGHMLFDDFQNMLAYDWLAFDSLAIYPHLTKGGKLGALEPIDGTLITPMIDYYGRIPESPSPAFVQWVNGLPWTWLNRDQLIYRPHRKRTNKLYGMPPTEWMLTTINTDIRHQIYFLQYFTEGSVPEAWINTPDGIRDPEQIKQFQRMYDAVMVGDQSQKHKIKFVPFGSKVVQAKDVKFDVKFPEFMLNKACAAWKVTPAELGFTEKVNKSSGETQENVQFRRSIRPSAKFFEGIYTGIIHKYFGYTNLRFKFLNLDEQEDLLMMAQRDEIYIKSGVVSPDEIRVQRLGLDVDEKQPVPRVFFTTKQVLTAQDALKQSEMSILQMQAEINKANAEAGSQNETTDIVPKMDAGVSQSETEREQADDPQSADAQKSMMDFFPSPVERSSNILK